MDEFFDLTSGTFAGLTFGGAPLPGKPDDQNSEHYFYNAKEYIKGPSLSDQITNIDKRIKYTNDDVYPAIYFRLQC